MDPERWKRIDALLDAVFQLEPNKREAFLDQVCAGDESLRKELTTLIAADERGQNFLKGSAIAEAKPDLVLSSGTLLGGRYEIVAPIGAGGMGEVYRARDPRIGRSVAIKVLPSAASSDEVRLRRFEKEAQAIGQLNHPNILAIYDIGNEDAHPYIVSELLEGETLRLRMHAGALSQKKAVEYSLQIAHGLAAAHEKGIVHRDLKPENIFVTKEGRVKILDFGLAKLMHPEIPASEVRDASTVSRLTETGIVLGTVVYMSPEQVRGERVDHRSDIFAFGAVLYEMLSGHRAFAGQTNVEVMNAILKEDPPEISQTNATLSPALLRIVQRCLEKEPGRRFQSTSDLAFAFESISGETASALAANRVTAKRSQRIAFVITAALLLIGSILAYQAGRMKEKAASTGSRINSSIVWQRLTFRRGFIRNARFTSDGQNVIYGAGWNGNPSEIYLTRIGSPESRALNLKASLLSVSANGDLAIQLGPAAPSGVLAEVPFAGGIPRSLAENIAEADWSPDGKQFAVIHGDQLESPIGKVLYRSKSFITSPRFSPNGRLIAFVELRSPGISTICIMDADGKIQKLHEYDIPGSNSIPRLAWHPSGNEIWFDAKAKSGSGKVIGAVTLTKEYREILELDGVLRIFDISKDGRLLLLRGTTRAGIIYYSPQEGIERDLSWLDNSQVADISEDGKWILFRENGEASGSARAATYLRNVDAAEAVRLGDGWALSLSPNTKWALSFTDKSLTLLPTGAGQAKTIPLQGDLNGATWMPDSKAILFSVSSSRSPGLYQYNIDDGKTTMVTQQAIGVAVAGQNAISPDGKWVIAESNAEGVFLYSLQNGEHRKVQLEGLLPLRWSADGRFIYADGGAAIPLEIYRTEVETGKKELFKKLSPGDPAGIYGTFPVLTGDGKTYAYTYVQSLNDLYVIEGLK